VLVRAALGDIAAAGDPFTDIRLRPKDRKAVAGEFTPEIVQVLLDARHRPFADLTGAVELASALGVDWQRRAGETVAARIVAELLAHPGADRKAALALLTRADSGAVNTAVVDGLEQSIRGGAGDSVLETVRTADSGWLNRQDLRDAPLLRLIVSAAGESRGAHGFGLFERLWRANKKPEDGPRLVLIRTLAWRDSHVLTPREACDLGRLLPEAAIGVPDIHDRLVRAFTACPDGPDRTALAEILLERRTRLDPGERNEAHLLVAVRDSTNGRISLEAAAAEIENRVADGGLRPETRSWALSELAVRFADAKPDQLGDLTAGILWDTADHDLLELYRAVHFEQGRAERLRRTLLPDTGYGASRFRLWDALAFHTDPRCAIVGKQLIKEIFTPAVRDARGEGDIKSIAKALRKDPELAERWTRYCARQRGTQTDSAARAPLAPPPDPRQVGSPPASVDQPAVDPSNRDPHQ
jgi:hypothetical protein